MIMTPAETSRGPGPIRIGHSVPVRVWVAALIAALPVGVAWLLLDRGWLNRPLVIAVAVGASALLLVTFLRPGALVVDEHEVRDESGWRRRGWQIPRAAVSRVVWEDNPDLLEPPPQLTFLDTDGRVLRSVSMEFDRRAVLDALRDKGWPVDAD